MANIKSAKKRTRQIEKRTLVNSARRGSVKSAIKSVLKAIDTKGDVAKVKELFKDAESKIAKAKNKIIHFKSFLCVFCRISPVLDNFAFVCNIVCVFLVLPF